MRGLLKWVGRILGGLVGLIVLAIVVIFVVGSLKLNKQYDVDVATVEIPTDEAALERGEHLANTVAVCAGCHTPNFAGEEFINDPTLAVLYSANLTSGEGGIGGQYSDEDWVRTLRHGVKPDGTSVLIMPSQHFRSMSDEDLGAVIAYVKTVPPVDTDYPERSFGPMARLFVLLEPSLLPAAIIDHDAAPPPAPEEGVTAAYGEYLVELATCSDCHGEQLNGAPSLEAGLPPGENLTPGGELAGWSEDDFIQTIRTGVNPAGRELPTMAEATDFFGNATDDELAAIFTYLQSLPARETGY